MAASAGKPSSIEKLGGRHLDRGAEGRDREEEGHLAPVRLPPPHQRREDVAGGRLLRRVVLVWRRRVALDLRQQCRQVLAAADRDLALEPADEVGPHLAEVDDPRREPARVQPRPHHVDRWLEQRRVDPLRQHPHAPVGRDQVPAAVDDDGGVGFVAGEDHLQCLAHRCHLRVALQRAFREDRRVAGGEQHPVALAEGDFEPLGEQQDHLRARGRATGLDKAQVPRGDPGLERQLHLRQPPPGPPLPQHRPRPGPGARGRHRALSRTSGRGGSSRRLPSRRPWRRRAG